MEITSIYTNTHRDHKVQRLMKQIETVAQRCNTDRITFFFNFLIFLFQDWGYIVWVPKPQRHGQVAKPPCSAPYENYPAVGKFRLKI